MLTNQTKKRWVPLCLAIAVAAGSWAVLGGHDGVHAQASAAMPPPAVTVAQTLVRSVSDADEFTGRLQAVDTVQLRPRVGGYIDRVQFTEGALVKKGQLLFQIDTRPFQAEVDRLFARRTSSEILRLGLFMVGGALLIGLGLKIWSLL